MKKSIAMCLILLFVLMAGAEQFKADFQKNRADLSAQTNKITRAENREMPFSEWDTAPTGLMNNYADYFQCYNQLPIDSQPAELGGGIYIMYRVMDQGGFSDICFSYIDADGNLQTTSGIGYPGAYADAEVDQQTGDVFGCWHVLSDDNETIDCLMIYDLYHVLNEPGLWKDPVITVINSDEMDEIDPTENDEFIWPEIKIGLSPVPGKQRIYLVASNHNNSDGETGYPSENVMICYADFDVEDLNQQSDLDWNFTTIPVMNSWNAEDPVWYRAFKAFTVIDNQIIFMGYKVPADNSDEPDQMFCLINSDYGEGEWEEYYQDWEFAEENPSFYNDATGETCYLYSSQNNPTIPYPEVKQEIIHSGYFNLVPTHDNTQVMWAGAMGVIYNDGVEDLYCPRWFQVYPKTFSFDLLTHEFSFTDVYPAGANPRDNSPMKPWDLDEDGEIDSYDTTGFPQWAQDWPLFHWDTESCFYYNEYYLSVNEDTGWMALVWMDGTKATAAHENWIGYEDYLDKPEIAVCISSDWGETWSEPIFRNSCSTDENYDEELACQIPCFIYPGEEIIDDGNGYGILPLFYLDDHDYGSYHCREQGMNNGSTFMYGSLRIFFGDIITENDAELIQAPLFSLNYPNPFNPRTSIMFQNSAPGEVEVNVYNMKGQKIKSLVKDEFDAGKHNVIWNGDNDSGSEVASGMYLYQVKTDKYSTTRKMVLMK
jgi:Secretion system C-terminal sorting domain